MKKIRKSFPEPIEPIKLLTKNTLKVVSIFTSIMGECNFWGQGDWSTFLRLSGCSVKCKICDSKYSWTAGTEMTVPKIISKVEEYTVTKKHILITGGEPLESNHTLLLKLIKKLNDRGYFISIETNGFHNPNFILSSINSIRTTDISFIMDYKLASSGKEQNSLNNYEKLTSLDYIKFVISNLVDFYHAISVVKTIRQTHFMNVNIYFSPCIGKIEPYILFEWMKHSECIKLNILYNLQIHKFIFNKNWRNEED